MLSIEFVPVGVHATPVVGSKYEKNLLPKAPVPAVFVLGVALPASSEDDEVVVPPEADFILKV